MKYFAHETAVIDEGCDIGEGVKIWHFSHIMSNCISGLKCNIGQNVVVSPKVILGKNVKVQNNVSIYTGVICDDAFIGAGAVVMRSVPDFALVVGNPSRQIGWVSEYGHRLDFNDSNLAICPESKEEYKINNNKVTRIK